MNAYPLNSDEPISVILISTFSHSGSTLLDLLIGGHSKVISGGEFRLNERVLRRPCTCGAENPQLCPFWKAVAVKLQDAGGSLVDPQHLVDEPVQLIHYLVNLFSAMLDVAGATYVLGSPKARNRLLGPMLESNRFDLKVVMLTRNPLGLLASHKKKKVSFLSTVRRINTFYFGQMRVAGKAAVHIRYERLVSDPHREMMRIMQALNISFEEGQLCPDANEFHNLGGNGMRRRPIGDIRRDDSWKQTLTWREKIVGGLLTIPARLFVRITELRIAFRS